MGMDPQEVTLFRLYPHLWIWVTVEQLRGLHVHLGGWRRGGCRKGSTNVLGDFPNLTWSTFQFYACGHF